GTGPVSGTSRPAMIRRSVVLPEPEGPSRASSAPLGTSRLRLSSARKSSKRLLTVTTLMLMRVGAGYHAGVASVERAPRRTPSTCIAAPAADRSKARSRRRAERLELHQCVELEPDEGGVGRVRRPVDEVREVAPHAHGERVQELVLGSHDRAFLVRPAVAVVAIGERGDGRFLPDVLVEPED